MERFRFKQFSVSHHRSAMKVGTDAVLLGTLAPVRQNCEKILDVGTGCGIIALMLAQRSSSRVDAIDIDAPSVAEARENFRQSPWSSRLNAINVSFQHFAGNIESSYDLIVSNPPFFQNSLLPVNERLSLAKHNHQLDFKSFIGSSDKLLTPRGLIAIILPVYEADQFLERAVSMNFYLMHCYSIIPVTDKNPNRKVMLFSREKPENQVFSEITLRMHSGEFSKEYRQLTTDFHPDEYFC
ncbi:MAG: methyltransferase [Bacteroidales bacterium]|nr:methyltransferase [Bacteroidales bacterium]